MPRVVLPLVPHVSDVALAGVTSALTALKDLRVVEDLDVQSCAEDALVPAASGLRLVPTLLGWDALTHADVVVVTGPPVADAAAAPDLPPDLARALRANAGRPLVVAADAGVLLLARAGFLTGQRVVAARDLRDAVAEHVGEVVVGPRVLRDGRILTAAGAAAGVELGLALVQALADDAAAERVADALEVKGWTPR